MRSRLVVSASVAGGLALCLAGVMGGCNPEFVANQSKQRTGNITFQFVNDSPFRAAFSFGTWDELDRTPGPATLQQLRLEAGTSSDVINVLCRRNAAVGTQDFVDRVLAVRADDTAGFDPDAFDATVHFSSADQDSEAAADPTQGTANGVEKLLGVDYSCGDRLIFTFKQDPDAPGGFRIDFAVLRDTRLNEE